MEKFYLEKNVRTIKNLLIFLTSIVVAYLLKELSYMFVPLILALFIAIVLHPALTFFQKRNIPYGISLVIILVIAFYLFNGIASIVSDTAAQIYNDWDILTAQITTKMEPAILFVNKNTGVDLNTYTGSLFEQFRNFISLDKVGNLAYTISNMASTIFMTLLYLFVMLGGILRYEEYLAYLEDDQNPEIKGTLVTGFEEIMKSITTYMKVKTLISLATGVGFGLCCAVFGVDFAFFWGFMAFLLNYIPTFGSILASIFPLLLGWIQIEPFGYFLIFVVILFVLQLVLGNVIDPMMMGSSLAINTVFVLLGLVVWGYLWGITGSILSVPLMVLIRVILQQLPDAQFLVRLMGTKPTK